MWTWRRVLIVCGYVCYTIALFALFIYLKFPSQQVRSLVLMALSRYGLTQVQIGSVQPLLPPGLAFRDVSLAYEVNGQATEFIRVSKLHLYLRTLLPYANPLRLRFAGELYGGNLLGTLQWEENGTGPLVGIEANLQEIHLAVHPMAARLGTVTLDGRLTGTMTLQIPASRWHHSEGRLVLAGQAGGVSGIEIMGMRLPPLIYEQLTGELALQPQSLIVNDILVRGHDWQVQAQGKVNLTEHLLQSRLELTLRIRTSEAFGQQLGMVGTMLKQRRDQRGFTSFKVGGTLGSPHVQL
jgi:type II secretion system protein N